MLVNFAREQGISTIVRGIRNTKDMEYETQIARVNHLLAPEIETLFLCAMPPFVEISSSMVWEIAQSGGDVAAFVPSNVYTAFIKKED